MYPYVFVSTPGSYEMVCHKQSIIIIRSDLGLNQYIVYRGQIDWTCLHVFHCSVSWFDCSLSSGPRVQHAVDPNPSLKNHPKGK